NPSVKSRHFFALFDLETVPIRQGEALGQQATQYGIPCSKLSFFEAGPRSLPFALMLVQNLFLLSLQSLPPLIPHGRARRGEHAPHSLFETLDYRLTTALGGVVLVGGDSTNGDDLVVLKVDATHAKRRLAVSII